MGRHVKRVVLRMQVRSETKLTSGVGKDKEEEMQRRGRESVGGGVVVARQAVGQRLVP